MCMVIGIEELIAHAREEAWWAVCRVILPMHVGLCAAKHVRATKHVPASQTLGDHWAGV